MTDGSDIFEDMAYRLLQYLTISMLLGLGVTHGISQGPTIDGLTVVAPPRAFTTDPFVEIDSVGSEWVAFVPYGFTLRGQSKVHYDSDRQWWGERTDGIKTSIEMAQSHGINIMLKPQIYIPGSWPGDLTFDTDAEWAEWEASYTAFILHWARLANSYNVEVFCIGTEFKISTLKRPQFWLDLIQEVRAVYCGELTYSANWDEYDDIPFWGEVDYIGVSAYYPLLEDDTPQVDDLLKAWKPNVKAMSEVSKRYDKKVLFTEYGYLSVDGCGGKTWVLEKSVKSRTINEECQANAIEALLETFGKQDWWAGGFLWKWFPNGMGHEGYIPRDYTPQGKQSIQVLDKYYSQW